MGTLEGSRSPDESILTPKSVGLGESELQFPSSKIESLPENGGKDIEFG